MQLTVDQDPTTGEWIVIDEDSSELVRFPATEQGHDDAIEWALI